MKILWMHIAFFIVISGLIYLLISYFKKKYQGFSQEEKNLYYDCFYNALEAIFIINVNSKKEFIFQEFNLTQKKFPGIDFEKIPNKTPDQVFPPEIAEHLNKNYQKCVDERKTYVYQEEVFLDNKKQIAETKLVPVFNKKGAVIKIIGFSHLVTDLVNIKKSFNESLIFQETLLNTLPVPVFYKNSDGVFLGCNQSYEQLMKIKKADLIGKTSFDISSTELAKIYHQEDQLLLKNPGTRIYESEVKDAQGNIHHIIFHKAVFYKSDGTVGGIVGALQEITEIKKYQQEIKKNKNKYREFLDSLPISAFELDIQGNFTFVNQTIIKEFGYFPPEIKKGINVLQVVIPSDWPRAKDNLQQVIQTGSSFSGNEYQLVRKDGTTFPGIVYSNAIYDNEKPVGIRGILINITERKITEKIKRSKEIAEKANQSKNEFLTNMSHEIRTPLTAVIGMADYLLLFTELTIEQKESLNIIKSSSYSLLELITDILDFAKIESGKIELKETEFEIDLFIDQIIKNFKPTAHAKNLSLSYTIDSNINKFIIGDVGRLRQILVNLIGNAIKFTESGSIYVSLSKIDETDFHQEIQFKIQDTGIGIAKDKQEIIFEAFTQADASYTRKHGGTGLGLAICKKLVSMLGGTLILQSDLNQGSTFSFNIHFKLSKNSHGTKVDKHGIQEHFQSKNAHKYHILLAEDNDFNSFMTKSLLEKAGYEVMIAKNGIEALKLLKNNLPDLILLDIQMPEMDGFETAKQIQAMKLPKKIPLIALSAYVLKIEKDQLDEYGFIDFITKPFNTEDLFTVMQKYLLN